MIPKIIQTKGQSAVTLLVFLVIVIGLMGLVVTLNYNGIVSAEKTVEEAQAQIGTVCQRRLDLIPNLIETVKGYAKHEQTTLEAVTAARAAAQKALSGLNQDSGVKSNEQMAYIQETQAQLTTAFRGVFALMENYPNLKASSNFLALQDQFEGTENRIAVARQRYNSAVKVYNTKIETFPGVFIAPMFGYTAKDSWEAQEKAYEAPVAKF